MRIEITTDDRFSRWLVEPITLPRWAIVSPLAVGIGFLTIIVAF